MSTPMYWRETSNIPLNKAVTVLLGSSASGTLCPLWHFVGLPRTVPLCWQSIPYTRLLHLSWIASQDSIQLHDNAHYKGTFIFIITNSYPTADAVLFYECPPNCCLLHACWPRTYKCIFFSLPLETLGTSCTCICLQPLEKCPSLPGCIFNDTNLCQRKGIFHDTPRFTHICIASSQCCTTVKEN